MDQNTTGSRLLSHFFGPNAWREWVVRLFAIGMLVFAIVEYRQMRELLANRLFWLLAPFPGIIGLAYHLLALHPRFANGRNVIQQYREFLSDFEARWAKTTPGKLKTVGEDLLDDLESHQPSLAAALFGAVLLTVVFAIPASISNGDILDQAAQVNVTNKGVLFAGLGAYVWIMMRMAGRINAGALTSRFMITSAVRAAVSLIVGYVFAITNVAEMIPGSFGALLYFLAGMFNAWAIDWLRQKAVSAFHPNVAASQPLPLNMVDGMEDDTADLLAELGVSEVQHLATSDPGTLTMRSLYPFHRVVDWIDQAILIGYFREKIVDLRGLCIRGVIDWVSLFEGLDAQDADAPRAQATIDEIARRTNIPVDAVIVVGQAIRHDYRVNLLCRLWQHHQNASGYRNVDLDGDDTAATVTPTQPVVPITAPVTERPVATTPS